MKQSIENEIKKHSLEKRELMNKAIALAEQGKLARVRFKIKTQLILCIYRMSCKNVPISSRLRLVAQTKTKFL